MCFFFFFFFLNFFIIIWQNWVFYYRMKTTKYKWKSKSGKKILQSTRVRDICHFFLILIFDKCNFYMILLSSYLLKLLVFLYFFWFDFYLYLSIHLCFEGMRRFQINLQGLYMQNGARPIESSQLTSSQAWIQEKTNPIKFKSS